MRILICSKNDLTANLALNHLLRRLAGHTLGLVLANKARVETRGSEALMRLRMAEEIAPRHMLFPLLDAMPAPIPESGPDRGPDLMSFRHLAERYCHYFEDLGAPEPRARRDALATFKPDLVLALKYGFLFSAEERAIPAAGILNFHSGPLPAMPGLHAVYWALHHGMAMLGCTVHRVDGGIDTGDMVALRYQSARHDRCVLANNVAVYQMGAEMLADAAELVAGGDPLPVVPRNDEAPGPYLRYPDATDIETFQNRGGTMVDEDYYLSLVRRYLPPEVAAPVSIPLPASRGTFPCG